jgi:uncharacterized C2H2 Zn-finger protein
VCPRCDHTFEYEKDRRRHLNSVHKLDTVEYLCTIESCERASKGKGFSRKDKFDEHVRKMHGPIDNTGKSFGMAKTQMAYTYDSDLEA